MQTYDWPPTIDVVQIHQLAELFRSKGYYAEVVESPADRRSGTRN